VAEDTGGANGLFFDPEGDLVVCESARGRITSIAPDGDVDGAGGASISGMRFNRPNDLWVAPDGGVYFSDPNYGGGELHAGWRACVLRRARWRRGPAHHRLI
jgi:sugar lactone lactonase YvrE